MNTAFSGDAQAAAPKKVCNPLFATDEEAKKFLRRKHPVWVNIYANCQTYGVGMDLYSDKEAKQNRYVDGTCGYRIVVRPKAAK